MRNSFDLDLSFLLVNIFCGCEVVILSVMHNKDNELMNRFSLGHVVVGSV